jgi:coenzyme PQQ precursor peptide PqqA
LIINQPREVRPMKKWSKPRIEEICVGMEINAYFPAEL